VRVRTAAILATLVLMAALVVAIYPLVTGGTGLSLAGVIDNQSPLQASEPVAPEFAGWWIGKTHRR